MANLREHSMTTTASAGRTVRRLSWLMPWRAGFQARWIPRHSVAGVAPGVVGVPQGIVGRDFSTSTLLGAARLPMVGAGHWRDGSVRGARQGGAGTVSRED
jgi:hypothetical protein